jgi:uncharacterized protein
MPKADVFKIGSHVIDPGSRKTVHLPVSVLSDHTPATLSAHIVHGKHTGPTVFVSAAIHGDEVIGVEIVRRILRAPHLGQLSGTLIAVPIVNSFGFMNHSRYLPDRRDLNRSFPGNATGSLAARLADLFFREVVLRSDVGIDIHSAAIHRTNLPQIRISTTRKETVQLAEAFGAPLVLVSKKREGSLRATAAENGVDILLYEAGEGLRFDEVAVRAGVTGVLRVLQHLKMLVSQDVDTPVARSIRSTSSVWLRAPAGGLLRTFKTIGEQVEERDVLGVISDPFGVTETEVVARDAGLLIGRTNLPVVNEGDGLFHVARVRESENVEAIIDSLNDQMEADPLYDEDEII